MLYIKVTDLDQSQKNIVVDDLLEVYGLINKTNLKPIANTLNINNIIKQTFECATNINAKKILYRY